MCSKRVISSSIKFADLLERCPKDQLPYLEIFKSKTRSYIDRINSNPPELPKINWEYYKTHVRPEYVKMVEEFEEKYSELVIPYPENPYEEELAKHKIEVETDLARFQEASNARIKRYENEICQIVGRLPYEQMTMEDYIDAFPDIAPDYKNRPTFWPHTEDEQIPPEKQYRPAEAVGNLTKHNVVVNEILENSNVPKESRVMIEALKIKEKCGK